MLATGVVGSAPGCQPAGQKFCVCKGEIAPIGRSPAANIHSALFALLLDVRGGTSHQCINLLRNSMNGNPWMSGVFVRVNPTKCRLTRFIPVKAC